MLVMRLMPWPGQSELKREPLWCLYTLWDGRPSLGSWVDLTGASCWPDCVLAGRVLGLDVHFFTNL